MMLDRADRSFADVAAVLKEYRDNIGDAIVATSAAPAKASSIKTNGHVANGNEEEQVESGIQQREIISQLIQYISAIS